MKKHSIGLIAVFCVMASGLLIAQKEELGSSSVVIPPAGPLHQVVEIKSHYGAINSVFPEAGQKEDAPVHCENTATFRRRCALTGVAMFVGLWTWFVVKVSQGDWHYQAKSGQILIAPPAPFP